MTAVARSAVEAVEAAADLAPRLAADAATTDRDGAFPSAAIGWLRDAGLLAAPLSAAHGGQDLGDAARTHALLRTLAHVGRGNLSVGRLYEGHVNGLALVQRFGTPEQVACAARDAAAGHLYGVWNTQPGDGVRFALRGAGRDAKVVLSGRKTFASGAGHVTRALVTAQDAQDGWQLLLIPTDSARPAFDASFWRPLGMRASASFEADFSGLELPLESRVGAPGDYLREPWFSAGAIRFVAVQMGGAEAVFDETRRFLRSLGRTGDPYQRQRLGEMARLVEGGALWLEGAARRHAEASSDADLVAYVRMARGAVEEICLRTLRLAERCIGARGLLAPEPFERLHRDLTLYLRQPAPDAAEADAGGHVLAAERPAHRLWRR